jgi:hypothetical protein
MTKGCPATTVEVSLSSVARACAASSAALAIEANRPVRSVRQQTIGFRRIVTLVNGPVMLGSRPGRKGNAPETFRPTRFRDREDPPGLSSFTRGASRYGAERWDHWRIRLRSGSINLAAGGLFLGPVAMSGERSGSLCATYRSIPRKMIRTR